MKKNWKKLLVTGIVGIGIMGILVGCGGEKEKTPAKTDLPKKVIVGLDDNFPPMGFRDENGKLTGFDIELAQAVGERLGIEIEFKPIEWASKEAELSSKRIDMIWNGLTITEERKKNIAFTERYMANKQIVVTLASKTDIKELEDLAGKIVASQEGATGPEALKKRPEIESSFKELKLYAVFTDALLDLEIGRVDAVVIDSVVGRYYMTKKPGMFQELNENLGIEGFGVGMRLDDKVLLEAIDKGIAEVKKDGTGEAISKKWFGVNVME